MDLNEFAEEVHQWAISKGWWEDEDRSMGEIIANIHSEASEAWEDYRNGDMGVKYEDDGKPVGFPTEMADIIIRVVDVCRKNNIDINGRIREKMDYNYNRPYRHGGKKA